MIYIEYIDLGKYIRIFDDTPEGRKTKIYSLCNQDNERIHLGLIKWHGDWRKYCFFPVDETVLDAKCLNDIVEFLDKINKLHKESRRVEG